MENQAFIEGSLIEIENHEGDVERGRFLELSSHLEGDRNHQFLVYEFSEIKIGDVLRQQIRIVPVSSIKEINLL